jgi:hypothetical protein
MIEPRVRQIDIAREAGVSRQYVFQVLSGQCPPSRKIIEACQRLGLPVDAD